MANLYLCDDLPAAAFEAGGRVEIVGEEAHHAVRVARIRLGESTLVGNGAGAIARGEVIEVDRDHVIVRISSTQFTPEPTCRLTLVQALAKAGRDERAVEQATEFGVDSIIPWQASRSVSRWDDAKTIKGVAKWQRIAREASKQSLRPWVPRIEKPLSFDGLLTRAGASGVTALVLHPGAAVRLSTLFRAAKLDTQLDAVREILIIIGPEGGLSRVETDGLVLAGARLVSLGEQVLRTSSAGPAAICLLNFALQRW